MKGEISMKGYPDDTKGFGLSLWLYPPFLILSVLMWC